MKKILFLCSGNSCRSQMAEGMANHYGAGKIQAFSAGLNPTIVNPYAIEVMAEIGIDISGQRSKNLEEFLGQQFDLIITLCESAKQNCPLFPGKTIRIHWDIKDPADATGSEEEILTEFRKCRDIIKEKIIDFLRKINSD
ncbi:MAG TPA: arsenate reductase ArsC [bacterium]|nr:arsenate reductase ArsC [bacterium]HOL35255.1 arsenate reductase ArsC [bacterium]HPP08714.1 arsenate reductase ArsC [bacterium]